MARVWVDELGRYLYDEEWEHYRDAKLAKAYMRSNAEDREKERRKEIEAERRESDLRRAEEDRRMKLEKHCAEHGLDFDVENRKYVRKLKRGVGIGVIFLCLSAIAIPVGLYLIIFERVMRDDPLLALLILGIIVVVLLYIGAGVVVYHSDRLRLAK